MSAWSFEVPGAAPAINSTYKIVSTKDTLGGSRLRLAKVPAVATWQDTVAWLVKAARPKNWTPARRVLVTIEWYSPRKRDCDAGVKACLDAVAVGLGIDDSCFLLSVPVNEIDKVNPRTVIQVENVE